MSDLQTELEQWEEANRFLVKERNTYRDTLRTAMDFLSTGDWAKVESRPCRCGHPVWVLVRRIRTGDKYRKEEKHELAISPRGGIHECRHRRPKRRRNAR